MKYRKLGNSGLDVSTVGLGTNNFGGRMDLESTKEVIHKSIDLGINFLDTANTYGNQLSEEYIGKVITKDLRRKVIIATKVGMDMGGVPNNIGASRKHILQQVEDSLRRLKKNDIKYLKMGKVLEKKYLKNSVNIFYINKNLKIKNN